MAKEYIEREKALEKVIEVKHHDPELSGVVLHRYIKEIDLKDIPAADVAPAVELEDLRAKYQALVAEKPRIAETLLKHIQLGIAMVTETGRLNCSNRFWAFAIV